jgi:putative transposase
VRHLQAQVAVSERRAARLVGISRTAVRYQQQRRDDTLIRQRLCALAVERPRFGSRRLHILLQRAGHCSNHKRVYRLYRAAGLTVRQRSRKRVARARVERASIGMTPNASWTLDFMSDALSWGRRIRVLSVLDSCTREALAIEVNTSLPSAAVIRVLEQVMHERGQPVEMVMDNGPELTSRRLDQWASEHGIQLRFIEPGKPVQNAVLESFTGRLRDECLNLHWFTSLDDAQQRIEAWRVDYNQVRPHSSLGYRTPKEVHQQFIRSFDGFAIAAVSEKLDQQPGAGQVGRYDEVCRGFVSRNRVSESTSHDAHSKASIETSAGPTADAARQRGCGCMPRLRPRRGAGQRRCGRSSTRLSRRTKSARPALRHGAGLGDPWPG